MELKIGDEYPVGWETYDDRPAGYHKAIVIGIYPYDGKFPEYFTHFLKLVAPFSKKGWILLPVDLRDY